MAFIPVPSVAKAALVYTFTGQQVVNTLYFRQDSAWGTDDLTLLAESLVDWHLSHLKAVLSANIGLTAVECTDLSSENGAVITEVVNPIEYGSLSGASAPANVAAVVTFRTALRGRSFRGRNYVGGLAMSQLGNAVDLDGAAVTAILAAYSLLSEVETATSATHVVVSRYHAGAARSEGIGTTVSAYTMDAHVDSQRRRLAGRGI